MTPTNDLLTALFAGSGLFCKPAGGEWMQIGNHPAKIRARATHETPQDDGTAIHIEVDVQLPSGKTITEWYIGQGKTADIAQREAVRSFAMVSAHVLLNAIWEVPIPGQVETQSWQIGSQRWRAWLGPFQVFAADSTGNIAPRGMIDSMRTTVSQAKLENDVNWFRFIHSSLGPPHNRVVTEAAKNNEPWPDGDKMLKSLQWPATDKYWSLREFVILTREHA